MTYGVAAKSFISVHISSLGGLVTLAAKRLAGGGVAGKSG